MILNSYISPRKTIFSAIIFDNLHLTEPLFLFAELQAERIGTRLADFLLSWCGLDGHIE